MSSLDQQREKENPNDQKRRNVSPSQVKSGRAPKLEARGSSLVQRNDLQLKGLNPRSGERKAINEVAEKSQASVKVMYKLMRKKKTRKLLKKGRENLKRREKETNGVTLKKSKGRKNHREIIKSLQQKLMEHKCR